VVADVGLSDRVAGNDPQVGAADRTNAVVELGMMIRAKAENIFHNIGAIVRRA
jgi:hypothetical protein